MKLILSAVVFLTALVSILAALVLLARHFLVSRKAVSVTLNGNRVIAASTGQKLLQVLTGAGVSIPSACAGAGSCGLCKITVVSGREEVLPTERAHLSEADIRSGVRLACQLSLHDDLDIVVPESVLSATRCEATVIASRHVTPLIKELVLQPPTGASLPFVAGNYIEITAPPFRLETSELSVDEHCRHVLDEFHLHGTTIESSSEVTRAYSIASRPADGDHLVLLIRLALPPPGSDHAIPPGRVSSWLFSRQVGDKVRLAGPFGDFHIVSPRREMVMIGGGVGMAPLRAMLHQHLQAPPAAPVHFYYGARNRGDLFYDDEFLALSERFDDFHFTVALSDSLPEEQWQGATDFIHEVVRREFIEGHPNPQECDYYLCGPPLMMRATMAMLTDAGVADTRIHADDFGS